MLRHLLRNYLNGLKKERHFDVPFGLLLPTLEYYDVHYTHGIVEFGKDYIAKTQLNGAEVQFSFQLKRGDIGLSEWRNDVQQQMLQSVMSPLSHPSFDKSLSHQAILVTTGEINTLAGQAIDTLNNELVNVYHRLPIITWSHNNLVDMLLNNGLESMIAVSIEDFSGYSDFFQLYSHALRGDATSPMIENDSRRWTTKLTNVKPDDFEKWALWCSLETEAIAQLCVTNGQMYEAVHTYLSRLRAICYASYEFSDQDLMNLKQHSIPRILELCTSYVDAVRNFWSPPRDILSTIDVPSDIVSYPVQCHRFMEMALLLYFFSDDVDLKRSIGELLNDFVMAEPGCAHPLSDRYAVSIVYAALALLDSNYKDTVSHLLKNTTIWICDRHEQAIGLAHLDSNEKEEIEMFLGYRFDFTKVSERRDSFLATAITDLSVFLGDKELYGNIMNDFQACGISCEYYQPNDTIGACLIEGEDVLHYPTVQYREEFSGWDHFDFAAHCAEEKSIFRFTELLGPSVTVSLSMVLRDRYFPALWSQLSTVQSDSNR